MNGKCNKKETDLRAKHGRRFISCDYCEEVYCLECYEFSITETESAKTLVEI